MQKKNHESIFTKSTVARRGEVILEDSNFGYYSKITKLIKKRILHMIIQ